MYLLFLFYRLDLGSSVPRMHFALTTPQDFAVTVAQASTEMGANVYLMVRAQYLLKCEMFLFVS